MITVSQPASQQEVQDVLQQHYHKRHAKGNCVVGWTIKQLIIPIG